MSEHIFISYSHKDSAVADILATTLHRAGIPIFIDKIALHPGESLTSKIGHGLQNAKALIVLLSKSSVSSEWVLKELNAVKTLNIPIVPFLCDKTEWPTQIKLLLGDPLYLDGGNDFYNAIGIVPKLFPQLRVQEP